MDWGLTSSAVVPFRGCVLSCPVKTEVKFSCILLYQLKCPFPLSLSLGIGEINWFISWGDHRFRTPILKPMTHTKTYDPQKSLSLDFYKFLWLTFPSFLSSSDPASLCAALNQSLRPSHFSCSFSSYEKKNHLALNISIISDIINEVTRSHIVSHCLLTVLPLLSLLATLENLRFPGIEQFFPYSGCFRVSDSTPKLIKVFTKKKKKNLPSSQEFS